MNTDPSEKDRRWDNLVRQARGDVPPPVDVTAAILREASCLAATPAPDWSGELSRWLGARVWLTGAVAASALVVGGWTLREALEKDLPWVELAAATATGGEEDAL